MVFKRINSQINDILENRQISRMRMPLKHQRDVISVKQIRQIIRLLKVEIAGVTLRCVFLEEMRMRKHKYISESLIFLLFQNIFKPVTLVDTQRAAS